jgi:hypothetical protein
MLKKWALFSGMLFAVVVGTGCGSDEEPKKAPSLAQNPEDLATWRSSEATQRETGIARWGFENGNSDEGVVRGYPNAESITPPSVEIRYRMTDKELVLEAKDKGAIRFDISDPDNVVVISDTLTEDANHLASVVSSAVSDLEASEAAAEANSKEPSLLKKTNLRPSGKVVLPGTLVERECALIKRDCHLELINSAKYAATSGAACQLAETRRNALAKCTGGPKACEKLASEAIAQRKACSDSIQAAHDYAQTSPECTTMKVTAKECGVEEPPLNSK